MRRRSTRRRPAGRSRDVEAAIAGATAAGGTLLYRATTVGSLVVAEVSDSMGNRNALSAATVPALEG